MPTPKKKIIKAWAVMWSESGQKEYYIPIGEEMISVEPKEEIAVNISKSKIGRPKIRYAACLAIFSEEDEATAFRDGNPDFEVIPVEILLPSRSPKKKAKQRK